jgi:hypothetical protein
MSDGGLDHLPFPVALLLRLCCDQMVVVLEQLF